MPIAVVVIDMLNPYDHEDAEALAANVPPILEPMSALASAAQHEGAELVYVNDKLWGLRGDPR